MLQEINHDLQVVDFGDDRVAWPMAASRPYASGSAAFAGADTVDAFSAINEPRAPLTETRSPCKHTLMCPGGDIHLSNTGYALVARPFDRASGF